MFVDTTLRDAHQSLIATRMRTEDMLPALEALDSMGFYSMEVWGGATFDVAVRFLEEDPWDRLRSIREGLKNTKIQMLLRGQNLVGYRNYADDVVELFVKKVAEYGLDIIRIFDALNDVRNLKKPIEVSKKYGIHVQGAISYTVSPVHTLEYYLKVAEEMIKAGVDSLCIKDMAGLLTPKVAYNLVKALKERFNVPVEVHSHCTTGLASMSYLAALEAGVDFLDTALSPLASGTSQPAFETMYHVVKEYGRKVQDIDEKTLEFLTNHFKNVRAKYKDYDVNMKTVDPRIILSQIPGGMYSNLLKQLKEQKMEHLIDK
ncbi:MAG TPA: pyruvate carboxylase subunit B, partial [Thermotoga sp.]|nr:pyruvate carboxylase subunit B [Thermotoga sp.]